MEAPTNSLCCTLIGRERQVVASLTRPPMLNLPCPALPSPSLQLSPPCPFLSLSAVVQSPWLRNMFSTSICSHSPSLSLSLSLLRSAIANWQRAPTEAAASCAAHSQFSALARFVLSAAFQSCLTAPLWRRTLVRTSQSIHLAAGRALHKLVHFTAGAGNSPASPLPPCLGFACVCSPSLWHNELCFSA